MLKNGAHGLTRLNARITCMQSLRSRKLCGVNSQLFKFYEIISSAYHRNLLRNHGRMRQRARRKREHASGGEG
jgi:hypothetical protein